MPGPGGSWPGIPGLGGPAKPTGADPAGMGWNCPGVGPVGNPPGLGGPIIGVCIRGCPG